MVAVTKYLDQDFIEHLVGFNFDLKPPMNESKRRYCEAN